MSLRPQPLVPNVMTAPATGTVRVLIVDDEPLARDCMRLALHGVPGVTIVAECGDGDSAVEAIRRHGPDVVLLDVQMPGLDGFAVLEQIDAATMPVVVFVTAFDSHAIRAFEVHALDYVLKPFPDERLVAAVDRARATIQERRNGELGRRLSEFVQRWQAGTLAPAPDSLGAAVAPRPDGASIDRLDAVMDADHEVSEPQRPGAPSYIGRFAVRSDGRVRFVAAADVDWIEADGNYMVLHVGETSHRLRASLAGLTEGLDPRRFVRIHRSVIVNVERIREVQPWFGGDYIAILRTGAKLRVSRLRAPQLLRPTA
ncbi:MAG TPA: LytTR family DNA-binding domain-containing protein [Gemmatimonadaceae bacterium]|nr:LytTR family DNA-binding domain-containing protein [Gemmatimonadaceae bacterium]